MTAKPLYLLLVVFFLLRFDLWAQNDATFVLRLPIGFTYHILYCLAATAVLWLLVRRAWPEELDTAPRDERDEEASA